MADFINFEAEIDNDETSSDDHDMSDDDDDDENSFISDIEINESRDFYRQFANVENDLEQVLSDVRNEALQDIEQFDEISNLNNDSENEMEVDDFEGSEDYLKKFNKTLFRNESENQNQFCQVLLLALKFKINGTKNACDNDDLEKILGKDLVEEINQPEKFIFIIDQ